VLFSVRWAPDSALPELLPELLYMAAIAKLQKSSSVKGHRITCEALNLELRGQITFEKLSMVFVHSRTNRELLYSSSTHHADSRPRAESRGGDTQASDDNQSDF
jgi:hypothetical protein